MWGGGGAWHPSTATPSTYVSHFIVIVLQLLDLLHGMMLPSGNDAANVVAEHVGAALRPLSRSAVPDDWQPFSCVSKLASITNAANPHHSSRGDVVVACDRSGPSYTADWALEDPMSTCVVAVVPA